MPVTRLEIESITDFAGGESFGDVGPYQFMEGSVQFAVDPSSPRNDVVTDIELAPKDSDGAVRFSSDFAVLCPKDPDRANGRMLFDVLNRGNKTVMSHFNGAPRPTDPMAPLNSGNGFLMAEGYTIVFGGWQDDVPSTPGLLGMTAQEALNPDGTSLVGEILCWLQVNEPTKVLMLSHAGHIPHPAIDPDESSARLLVSDHPNEPTTEVPRENWSFVRVEDEQVEHDPCHIYLDSGFEPGRIYQLIYTTTVSKIVGLGFLAVRDMTSFFKYGEHEDGNPCAGYIEKAYAFGTSQSGRFLRQMIHLGLNEDEEERMAFDGIIAHIAGGMRGEFNLRFGQPSKDICFITPELFPFLDVEQTDPVTGQSGSLLARMSERGKIPKIMFTNTSAEYWRGDAALIHTNLETMTDALESEHVRRYHFAGTQHSSGTFPLLNARPLDGLKGQFLYNSVDYGPLLRASLHNLDKWVCNAEPAPPSMHPRLSDRTAVVSDMVLSKLSRVPNIPYDWSPTRAIRLDYGPDAHLGRTTLLPAKQGEVYPALVSDVDDDGNEISGIRLPDLSVPIATYSGWNLRHENNGNPGLIIGISGGLWGWTMAFSPTRLDREKIKDSRPSIEERYSSREEYLSLVNQAAQILINQNYLLAYDVPEIIDRAGSKYDYFMGRKDT